MGISIDVTITLPRSWLGGAPENGKEQPHEMLGPWLVDDYVCVTDVIGFGAIHRSLCDEAILRMVKPIADGNRETALRFLRLKPNQTQIDCKELIDWLGKFRDADNVSNRFVMVCGCFLNALLLLPWLERSPQTPCSVIRQRYFMGHVLNFVGDKWRVSLAGCARNGTELDALRWPEKLRMLRGGKG
jgi:hypothetical protein